MSRARSNFFATIEEMLALAGDSLLVDVLPSRDSHNNRARILRSGLVVSAFSHLESYIFDRFTEILQRLPTSQVRYNSFKDTLKILLCVSAVRGLARKVGFMDDADALNFVEQELPSLTGFAGSPPIYSSLGAVPRGTNMTEKDIQSLLKAFGVQQVWPKISNICSQLGASRISIKSDFGNLYDARNLCAHDSTSNIPTADLQTHLQTALLVGMAFDLAMSHAVYSYIRCAHAARAERAAKGMNFRVRFLDEMPSGAYREHQGQRTLRTYPSLEDALRSPTRPLLGFVVRDERRLHKALA